MNFVEILKKQPSLHNLADEKLAHLAQLVVEKNYASGDIIIQEGDSSNGIHFISEGIAHVYKVSEDGVAIPLNLARKNELVGEIGPLKGGERSATVEAISPVQTLFIPNDRFLALYTSDSDFARAMNQSLITQIQSSDTSSTETKTKNILERAWLLLQELAEYFPNNDIPLSHETIAHILGITRPRLTEALHELAGEGKIALAFHKISLRKTQTH